MLQELNQVFEDNQTLKAMFICHLINPSYWSYVYELTIYGSINQVSITRFSDWFTMLKPWLNHG